MHHKGRGPHLYIATFPSNSLVNSAVALQRVFTCILDGIVLSNFLGLYTLGHVHLSFLKVLEGCTVCGPDSSDAHSCAD